jgi:hypothetical protein
MQRVPEAELNAARILIQMKRYEDAASFLSRIIESYPGSPVAEIATKEKAAINGMKNVAEEDATAAESKEGDGKPKTEEAPPAAEAAPKA